MSRQVEAVAAIAIEVAVAVAVEIKVAEVAIESIKSK